MRKYAPWTLLVLIVFGAGYVVGSEVATGRSVEAARTGAAGPAPCTPTPQHQVIVYYFHRTQRDVMCRTVEAFAEEAVRDGFAERIAAKEISWVTADLDEVWNQDFADRYGLTGSSLVLVDTFDGRERGHVVCRRTDDLVGDKAAFLAYVRGEVRSFFDAWASGAEPEGG